MDQQVIDQTIGPINLSVTINSFLFGLIAFQFFKYFESGYKDNWGVKALVWWVIIFDTLSTALDAYFSWQYTIVNFDNPAILGQALWTYDITPLNVVVISFPVQMFFAYRIMVLTKSKIWPIIVVVLATTQSVAGIITAAGAFLYPHLADFGHILNVCTVWLAVNVATDVVISSTMVICLSSERRGWATDRILNGIMRLAIETASISTVCCLLHLVLFAEANRAASPLYDTNIHLIFGVPLARIYSNAFMATLNARASYRRTMGTSGEVESGYSRSGGSSSRRTGNTMAVSVEREVHLDTLDRLPNVSKLEYTSNPFSSRDGFDLEDGKHPETLSGISDK